MNTTCYRGMACSLLLLLLAGCHSATKGPRFDPYSPLSGQVLPGGFSTNAPFAALTRTNVSLQEYLVPPVDFYRLGPGDIVEIEVLGEKDSSATTFVGPDGVVYYSLLPGTFVWGKTLGEAKTALEDALVEYIRARPEVALTLRGVASRRVWILGNVTKPGVYTLAVPLSVLDAIASAGGLLNSAGNTRDIADLNNSFLMRDGKHLPINLDRLIRQGDLSQNVYLQPGDYLYVRPQEVRDIYVLGAVAVPNIVPLRDRLSLVGAIASAGGPVKYAYLTHVAIIRGSLSNPTIAVVDYGKIITAKSPDIVLEPGDIVYVPFTPYKKVLEFAEFILDEFVRTVALNEGQNAVLEDAVPVGVSVGSGGGPAGAAPAVAP